MSMKNIAVLFYDITVEYHLIIASGIKDFFKEKNDAKLYFVPVCAPKVTDFEWDYQYWTSIEVLRSKTIDAVIVVTNSFVARMTSKQLSKYLGVLSEKKIVSIAVPLDIPGSSYTCISSKTTYEQIVEHLHTKHNCEKFAYITGEIDGSPESAERVKSFKAALKKNKLPLHKEWIYPGDFSPSQAFNIITTMFKSKDEVPFDAILCANDYAAYGTIKGLESIGVSVPDDVRVIGFDDTDMAVSEKPTLSTINQHISQSAYEAAALAYNASKGKEVPECVVIEPEPVYRQSCGCVSMEDKSGSYFKQDGAFVDVRFEKNNNLNLFGSALNDISNIYRMLNRMETVSNVDIYFQTLSAFLNKLYVTRLAICLYDEEVSLKPTTKFVLPEKARLYFHIDRIQNICCNYSESGGKAFNPLKTLYPGITNDKSAGHFFIVPVSLREKNYGYMICSLPMDKYTVYEIYLKIIVNSFIHAYEFTKEEETRALLAESNKGLAQLSKTDELTKIYNRRGFMELAQRQIDLSVEANTEGCVFFFDLDGLKTINDTHGHKLGDEAIKTAAMVLKKAFHKADIVGRLSGDEFAVIAPGFEKKNAIFIRNRIIELSNELCAKKKLPFVVTTSLGVVEFNKKNCNLDKLLSKADAGLYREKEVKHSIKAQQSKIK